LCDFVAAANQPDELLFSRSEGCIGHHVEKADMQFADVLFLRALQGDHVVAARAQSRKGGQIVMCYQWHCDVVIGRLKVCCIIARSCLRAPGRNFSDPAPVAPIIDCYSTTNTMASYVT